MSATFKVKLQKDYTVMSNHHLRNRQLSLKAKGLHSLMLSLPDNWNYTLKGLVTLSRDGRDGVLAALQELEENGYLIRTQERIGGKFTHTVYTIYEVPNEIIITLHRFNKEIQQQGGLLEQSIETITSNKTYQLLKPFINNISLLKTKIQEMISNQSNGYMEQCEAKPCTENPCTENPYTAKPLTENPTQLNTNISNTKSINYSSIKSDEGQTEIVKEKIDYQALSEEHFQNKRTLDCIVKIICANANNYTEINKQVIDMVMKNLTSTDLTKIKNFQAYVKTCIDNAYALPTSSSIQSYAPTYDIAEYERYSITDFINSEDLK